MQKIIEGKRYNTEISILLAHDELKNIPNWTRGRVNHYLYKSPNQRYFMLTMTVGLEGEYKITPMVEDEAIVQWASLPNQRVIFKEAFPNINEADCPHAKIIDA